MRSDYKHSSNSSHISYLNDKPYLRSSVNYQCYDDKGYGKDTTQSTYDKNSAGLKFLRHTINYQPNRNYTQTLGNYQYQDRSKYGDREKKLTQNLRKTQNSSQSDFLSRYREFKNRTNQKEASNEQEISSPIKKIKSPNRERVHTQDNIGNYTYQPNLYQKEIKHDKRAFCKKQSIYDKNFQQTYSPQRQIGTISTNNSGGFKISKVQDSITSPYSTKERNISEILTSSSLKSSPTKITKKNKLELNDFKLGKCLGQGKFGNVYVAVHKDTGALFALKKVKKQQIREHKLQNQFMMEIKMQLYFNHKNILGLYGFFDDADYIYLVLQYMEEGSLFVYFKKRKILTEQDASRKMNQVLKALDYLHEKNIAHRDLKPQNIVISNGVSKLCDFGWSAICQDRRRTLCGTIDYVPPQVLKGQQYGTQVDLWCIGVLCYELLVGKAPFYHLKIKDTMKDIMQCDLTKIKFPNTMSNEAQNFIMNLLVKEPELRMKTSQALKHEFILKYKDEDEKQKQKAKISNKKAY